MNNSSHHTILPKKFNFLAILVLGTIICCQNKENKNSADTDTISYSPKKDTLNSPLTITKKYLSSDTTLKKLIRNKTNENLTCYEEEIIISEKWLKATSRYQKDSLPDSLTVFLKPFLHGYTGEIYSEMPSIDFLDIIEGNLDEDTENEKVLFIKYGLGSAEACHSLVLDFKNEKWLLIASVLYSHRYTFDEVLPEINSQYKILICKSGSWGSGHNGNYFHFYKIINDCLKNVLKVTKEEFFGFMGIGQYLHGNYRFISNDKIIIKYYYSYFFITDKEKADGSSETLDIIKDKETDIIAKWNEKNQVFEAINTKQTKLLEGYVFDFHDTLDIKYLEKYGTSIQKKGLAEIDKRFPKNSKK